jgi:hypothetical protein
LPRKVQHFSSATRRTFQPPFTERLSEALPDEVSELDQALNSAVGDLLESLQFLDAWAADAYAAEIQKVKDKVTDFLTPIMEDAGALEETARAGGSWLTFLGLNSFDP